MVTDLWIKMVYFKIGFAVSLLKSEGAKLTFPVMQLSKQDPDSGGNSLVALDRAQKYAWSRLPRGYLRHAH